MHTGELQVYALSKDASGHRQAELSITTSKLSKKPIEQLGLIKELNSLVLLSDGNVTLVDLHTLSVQLSLQTHTKSQANIFALDSSVQSQASNSEGSGKAPLGTPGIPAVVTTLAVGCKRRCLLFSWRDSQWQEPKVCLASQPLSETFASSHSVKQEVALPHQIRSLTFPAPSTLILGFSTSSYGKVALPSINAPNSAQPTLSDFAVTADEAVAQSSPSAAPAATDKSGIAFGGLASLGGLALKTGGYMGLGGIGRVAKNQVISTGKGELVVVRGRKYLRAL